jgi:hypothetical protein
MTAPRLGGSTEERLMVTPVAAVIAANGKLMAED